MSEIPAAFERAFASDEQLDRLLRFMHSVRELPREQRPQMLIISNISLQEPVLIDSGLSYAETIALIETVKQMIVSQQIGEWEQAGR